MEMLSENAKVALLLCGHLGGESATAPLDLPSYNGVVRWLMGRSLQPANLLDPAQLPSLARDTGLACERLAALLGRGAKLGFKVEAWSQSGIWVVSRGDPDYPTRYKVQLKDQAPAILYGAGARALLQGGGLAIVDSRTPDVADEGFIREVASWCARGRVPVVSGGARGIDQAAMSGALEAGGVVAGVLADSLLRRSVSRESRYALADGRLLLISPYPPEGGFTGASAPGRNRLIYALADYALVVRADRRPGGTSGGAEEELRRRPGRQVFVRLDYAAPPGNRQLAALGAIAFPPMTPNDGTAAEALRTAAATRQRSDLEI